VLRPRGRQRPHQLRRARWPRGVNTLIFKVVDEAERAKNWTKSKVRAKVEHAFFVIKRVFGFARVRYRGLDKNAHRLFVTCALANLYMARHHLLRARGAQQ
jgi:IS5 family transposase